MSDTRTRRLAGHLRRQAAVYAIGIFAFAFSPVPSMAADLINTGDIANDAVTSAKIADETISTNDIKDGRIAPADLNAAAKGAKVITYDVGPHDFGESGSAFQLSGHLGAFGDPNLTPEKVARSSWSASLTDVDGFTYSVPGRAFYPDNDYQLRVSSEGRFFLELYNAFEGQRYEEIYIIQTIPTSRVVTLCADADC